jgi:23S rRNA pseudouridine1911/1915/1917 synthase
MLGPAHALVTCRLLTGRTHQIRVHMTESGHPLVGDPLYGRADRRRKAGLSEAARAAVDGFARQALHARTLGFDHPVTGARLDFARAAPADMRMLVAALDQTASNRESV